jgi:transcriptional regulator with XRE-family HTH domain
MRQMGNHYKKETFADRLRKLVEEDSTRPTYPDIAKIAAGKGRKAVTKQSVSRWMNGAAVPDPLSLDHLAYHYNVTKEWLFFGDAPRERTSIIVGLAMDLLPEEERREVAKDVARRMDATEPGTTPIGSPHDQFVEQVKKLSDALKRRSKTTT